MYKYLGYFGLLSNSKDKLLNLWLELDTNTHYLSYYNNINHPENLKCKNCSKMVFSSLPQREIVRENVGMSCFTKVS